MNKKINKPELYSPKFQNVLKGFTKCYSVAYMMMAVEQSAQQQVISGDTFVVNLLNLCTALISAASASVGDPPGKRCVAQMNSELSGRRGGKGPES